MSIRLRREEKHILIPSYNLRVQHSIYAKKRVKTVLAKNRIYTIVYMISEIIEWCMSRMNRTVLRFQYPIPCAVFLVLLVCPQAV